MNTHSQDEIMLIDNLLKLEGISDYRFCKENDCYVCDRQGNFYSVCKKQYSKAGNLVKKYRVINTTWYQIYTIVKDNGSADIEELDSQDIMMERLLKVKKESH